MSASNQNDKIKTNQVRAAGSHTVHSEHREAHCDLRSPSNGVFCMWIGALEEDRAEILDWRGLQPTAQQFLI